MPLTYSLFNNWCFKHETNLQSCASLNIINLLSLKVSDAAIFKVNSPVYVQSLLPNCSHLTYYKVFHEWLEYVLHQSYFTKDKMFLF